MGREENDDEMTVTLTLEDNTEEECVVLCVFPVDNREYIALLPEKYIDTEEGEVYLYRYTEENGVPNLENIEDDDEFEAVSDAYEELLDDETFEELVSEEDL